MWAAIINQYCYSDGHTCSTDQDAGQPMSHIVTDTQGKLCCKCIIVWTLPSQLTPSPSLFSTPMIPPAGYYDYYKVQGRVKISPSPKCFLFPCF